MSTKEASRNIIVFARRGKWEGDNGLKVQLQEATKMALDLDYNEKPYFRSALWEATWKNHEVIVKALVEKGASVDFKDYQDRTPLHEAAYYGHVNLVEYFLDKGAQINALDKFGQSPLFRAVDGGRHEVVELLVKRKAETNMLDGHEVSVQHCAAFQGLPAMSGWLLYNGAWRNRFAIEGDREASPGKKAESGAATPRLKDDGEEA
eukprot:TRINITY_DN50056_c0_g1_i1.p1 TRINITY_DN50056_c0_g1~~TRINITY_DN50056_c0_g1_i1.p1  ORF type:complete len:206 (-),score=57.19 TRINITY_DN50056_c0_g1_i1:79-696(-)